jgi:hypothetical protein
MMIKYKRKDQSGSKARFVEVQKIVANVGTIYQCFYLEQVKAWMLLNGGTLHSYIGISTL